MTLCNESWRTEVVCPTHRVEPIVRVLEASRIQSYDGASMHVVSVLMACGKRHSIVCSPDNLAAMRAGR